MAKPSRSAVAIAAAGIAVLLAAGIQEKQKQKQKQTPSPKREPELAPNRADEPFAKDFSLQKSVVFTDRTAQMWNDKYGCVTCHTNGLYLIAGSHASSKSEAYVETRTLARGYLERYVVDGAKPAGQRGAIEGLVATASFLTISDMATDGQLREVTRKALDHVFAAQDESGAWEGWLKCAWPPFESDDHFGVTLAAVAMGAAPENYRRTELARAGTEKLIRYLKRVPPANSHHKGMLLWAASALPGIAGAKQREGWQKDLLDLQRGDGGWRLVDLGAGAWKRKNDKVSELPSDAYATGFSIFALRRSGVPATNEQLRQGLAWLRAHQRASGRWFVRSPKRDGKHFISHAATQFALMAFAACGEKTAK